MFSMYILKSVKHGRIYKGHCSNIEKRLKQHNTGKVKSTRPYFPYILIYKEEYKTRKEAISREKYLKTTTGRRELENILAAEMAELVDLPAGRQAHWC